MSVGPSFRSEIVTDRLVIIGAGQAGFALAAKLRALKDTRPITLIGAEDVAPYQRPPLSKKYLLGEMSFDRLLFQRQSIRCGGQDDRRRVVRCGGRRRRR